MEMTILKRQTSSTARTSKKQVFYEQMKTAEEVKREFEKFKHRTEMFFGRRGFWKKPECKGS